MSQGGGKHYLDLKFGVRLMVSVWGWCKTLQQKHTAVHEQESSVCPERKNWGLGRP